MSKIKDSAEHRLIYREYTNPLPSMFDKKPADLIIQCSCGWIGDVPFQGPEPSEREWYHHAHPKRARIAKGEA